MSDPGKYKVTMEMHEKPSHSDYKTALRTVDGWHVSTILQ